MAAIDELDVTEAVLSTSSDSVKAAISRQFWQWFHDHKDESVVVVKFWIIKKSVKVSDLQPVFVLLFGPDL